jgi:hypothetical protein
LTVSKPDINGVYKWGKINDSPRKVPKGVKAYLIHHNGTRLFRVEVSGKTVEIYKGNYYSELVKNITVKEIYIG